MNSELKDLYQQMIVDHSKRPRNFGCLQPCTHEADGYNPLCGDKVHLTLRLEGPVIREAKFEGAGCAISTASASMLTEAIQGRTIPEADRLFDEFHRLVAESETEIQDEWLDRLGKLAVFSGVREFPTRVKCAVLVWHTLKKALVGGGAANTESVGAPGGPAGEVS